MEKYKIWYQKPEFFRDGIMGAEWLIEKGKLPKLNTLETSHIFLKEIEALNLPDVFRKMQGEIWSPNGEARSLIQSLGLQHTSMSVGDVAVDITNPLKPMAYIVDNRGFVLLKEDLILNDNEKTVLIWLGQEDYNQYGECHGPELDRLIALGLAQLHQPGEHQEGFIAKDFIGNRGIKFQAVSLTNIGLKMRKELLDASGAEQT